MGRYLTRRSVLAATTAGGLVTLVGCGGEPRPTGTQGQLEALRLYIDAESQAERFSGVVVVQRGTRTVLDGAWGLADRSHEIANTADTSFCVCSMGKMFTAVAIGQLVEAGRLAFDDVIAPYVEAFPFDAEVAEVVTVHQLLTHRSGMGDILQPEITPVLPRTVRRQTALVARQPLDFAPGDRFSYSNSGFIVLGAVIESVTGRRYAEVLQDGIFGPAGMTETVVDAYRPAEVPGMAQPYGQPSTDAAGRRDDLGTVLQVANPSGGARSTALDMLRFGRGLVGGDLVGPSMLATLTSGKVRATGPGRPAEDRYAYGFEETRVGDVRIVGHSGGTSGYECVLDLYPDLDVVAVVLANQDRAAVPLARAIRDELTSMPSPGAISTSEETP